MSVPEIKTTSLYHFFSKIDSDPLIPMIQKISKALNLAENSIGAGEDNDSYIYLNYSIRNLNDCKTEPRNILIPKIQQVISEMPNKSRRKCFFKDLQSVEKTEFSKFETLDNRTIYY